MYPPPIVDIVELFRLFQSLPTSLPTKGKRKKPAKKHQKKSLKPGNGSGGKPPGGRPPLGPGAWIRRRAHRIAIIPAMGPRLPYGHGNRVPKLIQGFL
jgi:hypothetical protein